MSKYIIELGYDLQRVVGVGVKQGTVWVKDYDVDDLEELCADYINEHFCELQDQAYQRGLEEGKQTAVGAAELREKLEYQRGLEDAWECARKLFSSMTDSDIEKAFPTEWNNGGFHALINLQPQEAIAKLKAYEEKQKTEDEIRVGDEVEHCIQCFVVTAMNDEYVHGFSKDGTHCFASIKNVRKTGRHFDIESILEAMKA